MRSLFIKFMESVGFLMIDEVHEFGSFTRIKNIKMFNPEFFLSLSATPYKSDSIFSRMNIQGVTGGIIYEVLEEGLIEGKVLVKNKTFLLIHENKDKSPKKYSELVDSFIIDNKERNKIIVDVLNVCIKLKLKVLVLFSSKRHGYLISEKTGHPFICGDDVQAVRDENKKKFLKKKAGVLLASNIYKKGITLPECEIMFNVNEGKEQSIIIQRRGRITGKSESKKYAVCIDIFDNCNHFKEHSLNRLQAYEAMSSDGIEIFSTDSDDFLTDIEFCLSECFHE
jgi:superfamily II DNA or RNA helicase